MRHFAFMAVMLLGLISSFSTRAGEAQPKGDHDKDKPAIFVDGSHKDFVTHDRDGVATLVKNLETLQVAPVILHDKTKTEEDVKAEIAQPKGDIYVMLTGNFMLLSADNGVSGLRYDLSVIKEAKPKDFNNIDTTLAGLHKTASGGGDKKVGAANTKLTDTKALATSSTPAPGVPDAK